MQAIVITAEMDPFARMRAMLANALGHATEVLNEMETPIEKEIRREENPFKKAVLIAKKTYQEFSLADLYASLKAYAARACQTVKGWLGMDEKTVGEQVSEAAAEEMKKDAQAKVDQQADDAMKKANASTDEAPAHHVESPLSEKSMTEAPVTASTNEAFSAAYDRLVTQGDVLPFAPEYAGSTGYFDPLKSNREIFAREDARVAYALTTGGGRRIIIVKGHAAGSDNLVFFDRYAPRGGKRDGKIVYQMSTTLAAGLDIADAGECTRDLLEQFFGPWLQAALDAKSDSQDQQQ